MAVSLLIQLRYKRYVFLRYFLLAIFSVQVSHDEIRASEEIKEHENVKKDVVKVSYFCGC